MRLGKAEKVAWQATNGSAAEQRQIIREQHFVDAVDVVTLAADEIHDDDVELLAGGQGVSSPLQKIIGLGQRELQRDGEGNGRPLAGDVIGVGTDLRKERRSILALL